MDFVKWLLSSSLVQSLATKEVRHLATAAAGALLTWLVTHGAGQGDATNIAEGVAAIITGAGGYALSRFNASGNEARVQVAAQTGQIVTAADAKTIMAQGVAAQEEADANQAAKTAAAIAHIAALPDASRSSALARLNGGAA
jgi:hypothetical protein